jgi:hypothetical protein
MGVAAWLQFAEAVEAGGGMPDRAALVDEVAGLGLTAQERAELRMLTEGRDDPVAEIVSRILAAAPDRDGGSNQAEARVRRLTDDLRSEPREGRETGAEPPAVGAEPPELDAEPPPPPAAPPPPIFGMDAPPPPVSAEPPPDGALAPPPVFRGGTGEEPPRAYARIDLATGTARPEVVVVDRPFTATVGLGPRPSLGIVAAGPVRGTGDVDVVVLYDPTSLKPGGATTATLRVTADNPFPTIDVPFTALFIDSDPRPLRRLGVQYLRDGQVVGMAWRSFVAVDEEAGVADAVVPRPREAQLLDLAPLSADEPPDLVIAVCASEADRQAWVWTAYAPDPSLTLPDRPNVARLDDDTAAFALETRRAIQFSTDRYSDYLAIAGRAKRIGRAVPTGIADAVRELVAQPGRTTAPSVLLLTEEVFVPWELATIEDLTTPWGGASPFLGAHVAISRWPLSETKPRPTPSPALTVTGGAVVVADYTGVAGFGILEAALAEADTIGALLDPPMTRVPATLPTMIDLMRGRPAASLIHVALHGVFDLSGNNEGIVLVDDDGAGKRTKVFLTPTQLSVAELPDAPFVFLNCCQVGADKTVLGSYGGFASTLLEIGAVGVVAPLWNVDDDVAASIAEGFYAATWAAAPEDRVSPAEAIRRIRATYTEDAVRAGTPGITATLVAFQVFGHPRLTFGSPVPAEPAPTH